MDIDTSVRLSKAPNTSKKQKRRVTPYKLVHSQSMQNLAFPEQTEHFLGATALTPSFNKQNQYDRSPEILRNTEHNSELDFWNYSSMSEWEMEDDEMSLNSHETIGLQNTAIEYEIQWDSVTNKLIQVPKDLYQCYVCHQWLHLSGHSKHVENCDGNTHQS